MYHVSAQGVDELTINVHYYLLSTTEKLSSVFRHQWRNQLRQWLEEGCRRPVPGDCSQQSSGLCVQGGGPRLSFPIPFCSVPNKPYGFCGRKAP